MYKIVPNLHIHLCRTFSVCVSRHWMPNTSNNIILSAAAAYLINANCKFCHMHMHVWRPTTSIQMRKKPIVSARGKQSNFGQTKNSNLKPRKTTQPCNKFFRNSDYAIFCGRDTRDRENEKKKTGHKSFASGSGSTHTQSVYASAIDCHGNVSNVCCCSMLCLAVVYSNRIFSRCDGDKRL